MSRSVHWTLLLLACAACSSGKDSADPKDVDPVPPAAAGQPAPPPADLPPLISQDEADAKAAEAIQKENADAELEKLKKELGGG
ncbi:MAG TPA: hypothetical protein VM509_09975 [Planctomycetota bacterium]|nr:hypothetical protein [Planctomycetota bacterium]